SATREAGDADDGPLDLGSLLRQLRRQKEPDEIALLKKCMAATDAGHARAREIIRSGVSELDVYREVQAAVLNAAGLPCLVYGDFRATSAENSKTGGLPTDYVLKEQDLLVLDYSVVIAGYRSDFTNTYAVGEPTDDQRKLFEWLQQAMSAGARALTAGAAAKAVYAAASKPLRDAGHEGIPHHAGHGIGLAHPEPPILVPHSEDVLLAGDVVTLEPGLYLDGIGGMRIENNYLITNAGSEKLSGHDIALT
ncbi:MAG: M24 family metallopeptidase, partial [Planctomycetaceae bacterium]